MNDIEFAEKMSPFLGKPWILGDNGSKGWDCVSSMRTFFNSCGIKLPEEFRGWTWENYPERWERGEGMDIMKEYLLSLGDPVDINYIRPGDIIVLEAKQNGENLVSAGLYVGNGLFQVVAKEHGVMRIPIRLYKMGGAIVGIRRLIK